jgi:hypothetical protein
MATAKVISRQRPDRDDHFGGACHRTANSDNDDDQDDDGMFLSGAAAIDERPSCRARNQFRLSLGTKANRLDQIGALIADKCARSRRPAVPFPARPPPTTAAASMSISRRRLAGSRVRPEVPKATSSPQLAGRR